MQELLQVVIKRIRALEDAYHENTRSLEVLERRVQETSQGELDARLEAAEVRLSSFGDVASQMGVLVAKVQAIAEERDEEDQASLVKRIAEIGQVVAGLHASQQSLRESLTSPATRLEQRMEMLEERLAGLEGSIGDFRSMADHVIAHEAVLTTLEHQVGDQSSTLGVIEEQASTYSSQFEIFDRQLAAHRVDMNTIDERARSLEERLEDAHATTADDVITRLAARIDTIEQSIASIPSENLETSMSEMAARIEAIAARLSAVEPLEAELGAIADALASTETVLPRLQEIGNRMGTTDARFASLSERFAAVESLHGDVVRSAEEISSIRARIDEVTGERFETILERLEGIDRLAADVASHAGQLATMRGRQADATPILVGGEGSPEMHARLDELVEQVRELRESATMLESIRTLLAASDIEKMFDEIREHVAKLDAQVGTLFTLQRMGSESEVQLPS